MLKCLSYMDFQTNYPLSELTTFRIGGPASFYAHVANLNELKEALDFAQQKNLSVLVLGGGSNVLISDQGFVGLVIQINFKGIEKVSEDKDSVMLKVAAGEIWDDVVAFAEKNNFWGIENLSHVPGKTGAVPVQNVGCYGQEASDVVEKIEVLGLNSQKVKEFTKTELDFNYRTSKLNQEWKNKYVILSVYFRLSKIPSPNLTYVDLKKYFAGRDKAMVSLNEIRTALKQIRANKFPDLTQMGTVGSFFKNFILTEEQYNTLVYCTKQNFGQEGVDRLIQVVNKFPQKNGIKVPTAFLLDICGLKGKAVGEAKLWEKQPVVIVNTGNAKAADVLELFKQVQAEILAKTGMRVTAEPEFI